MNEQLTQPYIFHGVSRNIKIFNITLPNTYVNLFTNANMTQLYKQNSDNMEVTIISENRSITYGRLKSTKPPTSQIFAVLPLQAKQLNLKYH